MRKKEITKGIKLYRVKVEEKRNDKSKNQADRVEERNNGSE